MLREILDVNLPLAFAIGTEKARSELLIMPVLLEVYRHMGQAFSLFSGVDFTVDFGKGLRGVCDFLLNLSPERFIVEAPVVALVEAKNENIKSGIAECGAEMVAAQAFNERRGNAIPTVYGVVTSGTSWLFLRLTGDLLSIDRAEYHISQVERILGILVSMVRPPHRETEVPRQRSMLLSPLTRPPACARLPLRRPEHLPQSALGCAVL